MLTNTEYVRLMENLVNSTSNATSTPYSLSSLNNFLPPTNCAAGQGSRHLGVAVPDQMMRLDDEELLTMARNNFGNKMIQQHIHMQDEFRQRMIGLLSDRNKGQDFLLRMATDNNGNFIIQELLSENRENLLPLVQCLENIADKLALNRYGCRVLQKLVQVLPPPSVRKLMETSFAGIEFQLITDQNGNHIVQHVVNNHLPEIYLPFIQSLDSSVGLKQVVENKYGCRVLQCALERAVLVCRQNTSGGHLLKQPESKSAAYEVLHLMVSTVLNDAHTLAKQEFGNYIVQAILKADFLAKQRVYIIKNHLLTNILDLSQGKYSSHVVEVAISNADEKSLEAIFLEVFEGYEADKRGHNALHIMLFHQYGNYVVQRLLEVAIQVRLGQRVGNPQWFNQIVSYAYKVNRQLARYSSGKKVLETIKIHCGGVPPLLGMQMHQPPFAHL